MLDLRRVSPGPTITGLAIALLLVLPLASASRAEAYVYWTSPGSIGRADLDGTRLNSLFIPVSTVTAIPSDLALDAEHVYWAAACDEDPAATSPCTEGAVGRANLDGTGVNQSLIGGINPRSVAVDADYVYWTWTDCDEGWGVGGSGCTTDELLTGAPGGIARANLDGTVVDPHFISGIDAGSVVVDAQHIYWTDRLCEPGCSGSLTPTVGRANLDGTGVDRSFVGVLPSGASGAWLNDLAIDVAHLYWSGQLFSDAGLHGPTLGRANLDGSGVDGGFIGGQLGPFHMPFWTGVAVDDAHLYWSEYEPTGEESILRANLDGGDQEHLIGTGADTFFSPGALAVDALSDDKVAGKVSVARTQRQPGKHVVVKVKVKAKERLTANGTGKIKVNPTYKLKPNTVKLDAGEARTLKLKPKRPAQAKKVAGALKRGEKATARLKVKLTDQAGNTKTQRLRVKLKAQARSKGR